MLALFFFRLCSIRISAVCRPRGHVPAIVQPDLTRLLLSMLCYCAHLRDYSSAVAAAGEWTPHDFVWSACTTLLKQAPSLLRCLIDAMLRQLSGKNVSGCLRVFFFLYCKFEIMKRRHPNKTICVMMSYSIPEHSSWPFLDQTLSTFRWIGREGR